MAETAYEVGCKDQIIGFFWIVAGTALGILVIEVITTLQYDVNGCAISFKEAAILRPESVDCKVSFHPFTTYVTYRSLFIAKSFETIASLIIMQMSPESAASPLSNATPMVALVSKQSLYHPVSLFPAHAPHMTQIHLPRTSCTQGV